MIIQILIHFTGLCLTFLRGTDTQMPQNNYKVVHKKKTFENEVNERLTTHPAQDFNNIIDSFAYIQSVCCFSESES